MSESILQGERECYITGATQGLHRHHIYGGGRRQISEAQGFWVWLRHDWHNTAPYGVHNNPDLDRRLKQECQERYEETHSREEFMGLLGKNYL